MASTSIYSGPKDSAGAIFSSRRRFLKSALTGAFALSTTAAWGHEIEANRLIVNHVDVVIPGWPRTHPGIKIGHLSDLHCDRPEAVTRAHRAAEMLLDQKPDVVFLTGDYTTGRDIDLWGAACADALSPLAIVPGGVFAVLGNHDQWWPQRISSFLTRAGFTVLHNSSMLFPGVPNVVIVGLKDALYGGPKVKKALQGIDPQATKLLLVHEPDFADETGPGFALQFSGHSHGGQIRIPGLPPLHVPPGGQLYPEGLRQARHHQVYTTRGVGVLGLQMRLFCPPEITVVHIHPSA